MLNAQRQSGRAGELLSRNDIRDITQPILNPEREEAAGRAGAGTGGAGFLGGLFGGTAKATAEDAAEEV